MIKGSLKTIKCLLEKSFEEGFRLWLFVFVVLSLPKEVIRHSALLGLIKTT
jgi:hypothetical protein